MARAFLIVALALVCILAVADAQCIACKVRIPGSSKPGAGIKYPIADAGAKLPARARNVLCYSITALLVVQSHQPARKH